MRAVTTNVLEWAVPRLKIYVIAALAGPALLLVGTAFYTYVWPGVTSPVIDWAPPEPPEPVPPPPIRLPGDLELVLVPGLQLTAEDAQLLLAVVKPSSFARGRKYSLGGIFPGSNLTQSLLPLLPDEVTKKVPRLRGFRYDNTHDAVLIVDPITYRIVAMIGPIQEG
jgi:hypothetical protein